MSHDATLSLRSFYTLQKIAYYATPPPLIVRSNAIGIFKLPADSPRIRNTVLGFAEEQRGEEASRATAEGEKKEIMFLMLDEQGESDEPEEPRESNE